MVDAFAMRKAREAMARSSALVERWPGSRCVQPSGVTSGGRRLMYESIALRRCNAGISAMSSGLPSGSFVIGLVSANGQVFQNVSSASRSTA